MNALNTFIYSIGWFLSIFLAAKHEPIFAASLVLITLIFQLWLAFYFSKNLFWNDLFLAVYALMIGFFVETWLININAVHYVTMQPGDFFPPLWVVLLYPLFSTTFNHSLSLINQSKFYPVLIGLLAPLSYFAGFRLGACTFPSGMVIAFCWLAVLWITILFILIALNRLLFKISEQVDQEFEQKSQIQMLYDKECPLCSREVSLLNKSEGKDKIDFVDISDKDYQAANYKNLSYQEAMKQLYAIDEKGTIMKGTEAFYTVYARIGWKGLAIALKAPLFRSIFKIGYAVFAKSRLFLTGRRN